MLSARELQILTALLAAQLEGARLKKVYDHSRETFVLRFSQRGQDDRDLILALRSILPRVNLLTHRHKAPRQPSTFVELLRAQIQGGLLSGLETLPDERIVRLSLTLPRGLERRLYVELLPAARNLIITDEQDLVLLMLRSGGARRQQRRDTPYIRPEAPPAQASQTTFAFLEDCDSVADLPARLEAWVGPRESAQEHEQRIKSLVAGVARSLRKTQRLAQRLQAELENLPDASELRRLGDVLKVHLARVPRGAREVTLEDFSSGIPTQVTIPLDPRRDARGNLERYFKDSRKADRARPKLEARLHVTQARLEALLQVTSDMQAADSEEALGRVISQAEAQGLILQKPSPGASPPQKKPGEPKRRQPQRTFTSRDGLEILVGRTARDNDQLTFQVARGNDWWFHVADHSGSHVIVRCPGELPQETLLDAATLAAHYSQAPKGAACDVSWTRRKWVRKFRGAAPGQVQLAQRKTLRVRPDPERLARLGSAQK